ncbi:MAG: transglycosylase domain-containing protein [Tissierellia bacterium]|nr:transglycosylase domain-containing protein [Tissierellia bacterium]
MFAKISKSFLHIIALIILVFALIAIVVGAMLGISFVKIAKSAPDIQPDSILLNLAESSKILDKDGNIIEEIASEEYRDIVEYDDIPKYLIDAIISVEDERFEKHKGVDIQGILISTLDNLRAGGIVRGGSTITQQLVKNIYLSPDVQWERKIIEMYLALQVDSEIDKERILEAYLNRVYMGQHAYGVQAASQIYFSKDVKDLSLAQAATLAGIVKSPSNYSLFASYNPSQVPKDAIVLGDFYVAGESFKAVLNEDAFERKNYVLEKMKELGKISEEEYQTALAEDVSKTVNPGSKKQKDYSNHIANLIRDDAIEILMDKKNIPREEAFTLLYTGGLNIKTSIDWNMQKKLEEAYEDFAQTMSIYNSYGNNPLMSNLNYDSDSNILNSNNRVVYFYKENLLTKDKDLIIPSKNYTLKDNGDITFNTERITTDGKSIAVARTYEIDDNRNLISYRSGMLQVAEDAIKNAEGYIFTISSDFFKDHEDFYKILDDKTMIISRAYFSPEEKGTLQPQSATVIIDQKTGYIKALVGARGNSPDDTIDRASNFTRPPASTMKPLAVYAPALENGYTLATALDDVPSRDPYSNTIWPRNIYDGFKGIVSLRQALKDSINTTAVSTFKEIGMDTSFEYLKGFGLIDADDPSNDNFISKKENPDHNDENLATALGAVSRGFTVKEMASAYSTLANGGVRNDASIIISIESKREGTIYDKEAAQTRVLSKETAWLITDVLRDTLESDYYGRGKNPYGIEMAAKTGTSNGNKDFWVAGYNPYYTAVTWMGYDNNALGMQGYSTDLYTFYMDYNIRIMEGMDKAVFEKPETITTAQVDAQSGLKPNQYTSMDPRGNMIRTEYFAPNTQPTEISKAHIMLKVDKRNNLLAASYTPKAATVEKVFIKRQVPFNINDFRGVDLPYGWSMSTLYPADYKYEAPNAYSDLKFEKKETTEKLPDGSIVTTKTDEMGTTVITTKYPDGSEVIITRTYDGKETKEVKEAPKKPNDKPNGNSDKKPGDDDDSVKPKPENENPEVTNKPDDD